MMTPDLHTLGIDRMSIDERFTLINAIRDSIAAESSVPVISDALREELERRLAAHAANPNDAVPWEVVKAKALARIQK